MTVSYSAYTKVQKVNHVRKIKSRCKRNNKKLCDYQNIEIVEGTVCSDYVYLCLSIPQSEKCQMW